MRNSNLQTIGHLEEISIPQADIFNLPAKVDTGAYSSSIWASDICVENGILKYTLLSEGAIGYSGKKMQTKNFSTVRVHNSFGAKEKRYRVQLSIILAGRRIKTKFTLSNRELKSYPVLIGRRALYKKFNVDVSKSSIRHLNSRLR